MTNPTAASEEPSEPTARPSGPTVADIEAAAARLEGVAVRTPLQLNERLSQRTGAFVWLKREDLQPVRSYKIRGAYNLIAQLGEAERAAGVICASAGNHGQGVAFACARLGIRGRIFVPSTTPRQKRDRMRALGEGLIELVVTGDTYDDAAAAARVEAARTGASIVPAFDDPRTIAGQGTVAREIVEQFGKAPDVLLVPVGGGGMLAGCLTWMAEHHPET
ncbi:MAG: pyridoxal-phosphate dependent enzyme, partial [Propionicimonas sp.]